MQKQQINQLSNRAASSESQEGEHGLDSCPTKPRNEQMAEGRPKKKRYFPHNKA
jgi:hypothetical protein